MLGTTLAIGVLMIVSARSAPEEPRALAILLLALGTLVGCGLWGLVVGVTLPTPIGIPAAVAAPFWWIAVTPAQSNVVVRHLAPEVVCCRIDTQVTTHYLLARGCLTLVFLVGLAALLWPAHWSRVSRTALLGGAVAVTTAAALAGVLTVRSGGTPVPLSITEPRTTRLVCVEEDGLRLCVWPEQQPSVPTLARVVRALNTWVDGGGLEPVTGVDQRDPRHGEIAARTVGASFGSVDEARLLVAAGYVAREAGCRRGLYGDRAGDERVAALALAMGVAAESLREEVLPAAVAAAETALASSRPGSFAEWFRDGVASVACSEDR
ncbi:hypothetical protein [Nocardioides stalactiti]|uniref:hypothetical protein n=1 Tax=Nocardioides stalactiti TaxID=2755356 RepID=UPI0016031FDB|nr:hypothetical protein [Nocardioides stalactiti]